MVLACLRLLARETRVSDPISDSGFSSATITLGGTLHVNITLGGTLHVNSEHHSRGYTACEHHSGGTLHMNSL